MKNLKPTIEIENEEIRPLGCGPSDTREAVRGYDWEREAYCDRLLALRIAKVGTTFDRAQKSASRAARDWDSPHFCLALPVASFVSIGRRVLLGVWAWRLFCRRIGSLAIRFRFVECRDGYGDSEERGVSGG